MKKLFFLLTSLMAVSCGVDYREAMDSISETNMKEFVKTIGSDDFQGRKPFTEGEVKTLDFLQKQLERIGFEPAFADSYLQKVPLVQITTTPVSKVCISSMEFSSPEEIAVNSPLPVSEVSLDKVGMVFCGFGIVAPEYGWNDYEGVDVRGKVVVVLINDPGLYLSDSSFFKGRELTYYGRWTYKFEEAARQGAAGVLIVHEDFGAGYNWGVASRSANMGSLYINDNALYSNCKVTGWIRSDIAQKLLGGYCESVSALRMSACSREFKSFEMKESFSVALRNSMVENQSYNVAGILRGSSHPEEAVVISGHWDHFGIGAPSKVVPSDSIYNGAVDNGTTMAWALEIGRAFKSLKERPARSLLILFPTSEEEGLLGSKYYVKNPAVPIEKTVACLNNDMMQPRGRMNDLMLIGRGYSPLLDSLYNLAAQRQGRYIISDPNAHTGMFFRSDHFAFFNLGVPSMWAMGCYDSREHGKEWAAATWQKFLDEIYHTPLDNYDPDWDWEGIVDDTKIGFDVAWHLANPE